jgi:hypothetical protein
VYPEDTAICYDGFRHPVRMTYLLGHRLRRLYLPTDIPRAIRMPVLISRLCELTGASPCFTNPDVY